MYNPDTKEHYFCRNCFGGPFLINFFNVTCIFVIVVFSSYIILSLSGIIGTLVVYSDVDIFTGCLKDYVYNSTINKCLNGSIEVNPVSCTSVLIPFTNEPRPLHSIITGTLICDLVWGVPTIGCLLGIIMIIICIAFQSVNYIKDITYKYNNFHYRNQYDLVSQSDSIQY